MQTDLFEEYRSLLFAIAYRMLGSAMEAEDIVQEAYLRYRATPPESIRTLKSFLTTIVHHLCMDHLKSAQVRREHYVGPWLPEPIITPTSKAFDGGHDEPLSGAEILQQGLLTAEQWETVSRYALALFARGQARAAERGLILVDTKYEFGTDKDGRIVLADEIHTPDSSRYWIADSYEQSFAAGGRPVSFDKDFVRAWVTERCDPYKDPIPEIPRDLVEQTSKVYIQAYEQITGKTFVPDLSGATVLDRIRENLKPYFA